MSFVPCLPSHDAHFFYHYLVKTTSWYNFLHRTIRRSRHFCSSLLMTFVVTSACVGQILMIFQSFFTLSLGITLHPLFL